MWPETFLHAVWAVSDPRKEVGSMLVHSSSELLAYS